MDGMELYFVISKIVLCNCILATHSMALFILLKLKSNKMNSNQRLYLQHLTVTQFMHVIVEIIKNSIQLSPYDSSKSLQMAIYQIDAMQLGGLKWLTSGIMTMLTVDRFLEVHLNLKYHVYCSAKYTKYMLISNWCLGGVSYTLLNLLSKGRKTRHLEIFKKYIYNSLNLFYVGVAVITYVYLFTKFYESKKVHFNHIRSLKISFSEEFKNVGEVAKPNMVSKDNLSIWKTFCRSNFYLPTFLVIGYILLYIIPGLTYAVKTYIMDGQPSLLLKELVTMSSLMAILMDPIIYVFASKVIRHTLRHTLILKLKSRK